MKIRPIPRKDDPALQEARIRFTETGEVNAGTTVEVKKTRWFVPYVRPGPGEKASKGFWIKLWTYMAGEIDQSGGIHFGAFRYFFYFVAILGVALLMISANVAAVMNWTVFAVAVAGSILGILLSYVILQSKKGIINQRSLPGSKVIIAYDESKTDPEARALVQRQNQDYNDLYIMPLDKFNSMPHFGAVESQTSKNTPMIDVDSVIGNGTWTSPIPELRNVAIARQFPGDNKIPAVYNYTYHALLDQANRHKISPEDDAYLHDTLQAAHNEIESAYNKLADITDRFGIKPYNINKRNQLEKVFLYSVERYTQDQLDSYMATRKEFLEHFSEMIDGFNMQRTARFTFMEMRHREDSARTEGIQMGIALYRAAKGNDPAKIAQLGPALALDLDRVLMAAQKTRSDADYETYMKKIEREIDGEQDQ